MIDWNLIFKLERISTYRVDYSRLFYIEDNWDEFLEMEYYVILEKLKANILNPIQYGFNYNQRDILRHLKDK